jgi:hypothetical protein
MFPHLENTREAYIRVNPSGAVMYRGEERDNLQRTSEYLRQLPGSTMDFFLILL